MVEGLTVKAPKLSISLSGNCCSSWCIIE
jgi:hypothetical protein